MSKEKSHNFLKNIIIVFSFPIFWGIYLLEMLFATRNPLVSIIYHACGNFLKTVTLISIAIPVVLIMPQLVKMIRNINNGSRFDTAEIKKGLCV